MTIDTVIYHSADYDGIFCREIARKFLPNADLIGWNFGDPPIDSRRLGTERLLIMDLPVDQPFGLKFKDGWILKGNEQIQPIDRWDSGNVIWIDHHKSSIDSHPKDIPGYRIDGVAACRLAWHYFFGSNGPKAPWASKANFVNREVSEPLAVRLAGEYDVWDHRGDGDLEFQFGMRLVAIGSDFWEALLQVSGVGEKAAYDTVENGRLLQRYQAVVDADVCKSKSFLANWEGLRFLCMNNARFNSNTFAALDVPATGHDALLGFVYTGKEWTVSLYHAAHRKDLDLSQIAVNYGGGGHRGACGFQVKILPFLYDTIPTPNGGLAVRSAGS